MTFEQYKAKTREMVNEVSDLCNTAFVTDQMSIDEVIDYYQARLARIYEVCNCPDSPPLPKWEARTTRHPLECQPFGDKGLVRYPVPDSFDYIYAKPGELFEQLREIADGKAVERSIIRVVDGKDVLIWQRHYPSF